MALQGTGSADVVVDDVFVPTEMTLDPLVQRRGGSQYVNIGYRGYVGGENVGFSLGVAQRMVDEITILARTKKRVMDPDAVGDRGAFQLELGRVDASLRAARVYAIDELARATAVAEDSGEQLKPHGMARVEAAVGWATECICQAANRLFPFAGAGALHLDNPIQRTYRDLLGSGQHVVASNETMEKWGQSLMAASAEI
jgi:alkylation response protein AidB-like acyl-CoA dehydrogenase